MSPSDPFCDVERPGVLRIIAEIQAAEPDDTYGTVAARLGITRQRVGQVVQKCERAGVDLGPWVRNRVRPTRRTARH